MITITIDKRRTRVQDGTTILEAARRLDIDIPTLCHLEGSEPFTSCMVCLVREMKSDRFVPACSAPAEKGMVVDTGSETVRGARRDVLDLLLREHGGDCESPCTRACPLSLDITTTLRQIARGVSDRSDSTSRGAVPLLGSVERICPAPCERACRRKLYDESLSIRLAIRWAAEHDRVSGVFPSRAVPPSSGRKTVRRATASPMPVSSARGGSFASPKLAPGTAAGRRGRVPTSDPSMWVLLSTSRAKRCPPYIVRFDQTSHRIL